MKTQVWKMTDGQTTARSVLECGGKRSATPLSDATGTAEKLRRRCALPEQSKTWRLKLLLYFILLPLAICFPAFAQGTAFLYQGRLFTGGSPANGSYDLTFALFNASSSGSQAGGTLTNTATVVTNGFFAVTLDFGSGIFTGTNYWLAIGVRTNGNGTFTALTPLQQILPVPYAIYASNAASAVTARGVAAGSVTGASIASGTITAGNIAGGQVVKSLDGLQDAVVLAAGSNITLSTNGNTLTVSGTSGGGAGWALSGNSGTTAGVNFVGTTDNQPLELRVNGQRAFRVEPTTFVNAPNVIGGSSFNSAASAVNATISGGYSNSIAAGLVDSSIGGGFQNMIQARDSTIAGGYQNFIQNNTATFSTISGGGNNTNVSTEGTIGGGAFNTIQDTSQAAFIGGGVENSIQNNSPYSTIAGGDLNTIQANATGSTIGGGVTNTIQSSSRNSTIAGGFQNIIENVSFAAIGGGQHNTNIASSGTIAGGGFNLLGVSAYATIGGGSSNSIAANSFNSTIAGGGNNAIDSSAPYSTISGGQSNYIQYAQTGIGGSVIAGGVLNRILEGGQGYSTISGGYSNTVSLVSDFATIGGGFGNFIGLGDPQYQSFATIGGGQKNVIADNSHNSTIGGGWKNTISGQQSTIGGGNLNIITNSNWAAIAGGEANTAYASATASIGGGYSNGITNAPNAAIVGGFENTIVNGDYSTIAGGSLNSISSKHSFAAGFGAQAKYDDSFVWNDGGSGAANTAANQFVISATGGVFINTSSGGSALNVGGGATVDSLHVASFLYTSYLTVTNSFTSQGSISAGAGLSGTSLNVTGNVIAGGNGQFTGNLSAANFSGSSDRNIKDHFTPINPVEILDKVASLPITRWNFKADEQTPHIGPMAQDFYGAFNIGPDDKHITTVDEGGVALAAIQGLNQKLETGSQNSEVRMQKLEAENADLKARLEKLEHLVAEKDGGVK
jgi:hypothetical protein